MKKNTLISFFQTCGSTVEKLSLLPVMKHFGFIILLLLVTSCSNTKTENNMSENKVLEVLKTRRQSEPIRTKCLKKS